MKSACLGLVLLISVASAQHIPLRRLSTLRLDDIDDNPYQLRGPLARGIRRTSRRYNPLRLGDDNDWLRSGSPLRRTSLPLVRRGQLATRGLTRGLGRGLYLDDDNDNWYNSVMNRGRSITRGGLFGRLRRDDDDNWATSVMNRGRRLARGGLFGRLRRDDDDNWATSVMSRGRRLARGGLFGRLRRDDDDNWANSVMNRGRSLARRGLLGRYRGDDDDNSLWRSPLSRSRGAASRIGRTSLSQRLGLNDDDNNYENIFGRRAMSNSLQGLGNVATPLRLDDDDDDDNVLTRGISPLRNSFSMPQFNLNDDDNDRFSSLSSLRSSLGGPIAHRRFF